MGKIIYGIKHIHLLGLLSIFAVSVLISNILIGDNVSDMLLNKIAKYTLEIQVLEEYNPNSEANREVWITELSLGDSQDMELLYNHSKQSGFEYRKAEEFNYPNDMIVNIAGEKGKISFDWTGGTEDYIKFWMQPLSGMVTVTFFRQEEVLDQQTIDLYSNQIGEYYSYELAKFQQIPIRYIALKWGLIVAFSMILFLGGLYYLARIMMRIEKTGC